VPNVYTQFFHISRTGKALFLPVRMNARLLVNQQKCSVSVMPQLLDNAGERQICLSCCGFQRFRHVENTNITPRAV